VTEGEREGRGGWGGEGRRKYCVVGISTYFRPVQHLAAGIRPEPAGEA